MNAASQALDAQPRSQGSIFWPRILGPRPGLKETNVVCWGLFVAFLVIPICWVRWVQAKQGKGSITQLHSDFVYLYGDGLILDNYPSPRLYDFKLQQQTFNALSPLHDGFYGPSPYPPFVALFFQPFTRLSYESAFLVWLFLSLGLYLIGVGAIAKTVFPDDQLKSSLIFCFALAFNPFVFGTLFNGQLSTVGVFSIGVALYLDKSEKPFLSGLALSILIYKFTLLPFVILLLLLTRRFKALAGFASGVATLVAASTVLAGVRIWPAYWQMVQTFRTATSWNSPYRTQLWVHLDLNSCIAGIPGGRSKAGLAILMLLCVGVALTLVYLLWKSRKGGRPVRWLAWSAVLTWTLLLNVYVPIYDSVLIVIAIVLMLGALRDLGWNVAEEWTVFLSVVIFAVSWITESFSHAHRLQLLSIVLFILGLMQLAFLYRATNQPTRLREA